MEKRDSMIERFGIIYADPPWSYRAWNGKDAGRTAESHYPTMSLYEICSMPIGAICASDCALFLWATFPNLPQAFDVIRAWGFAFKTVAFVWAKTNKKSPGWHTGLGHWTRANAELCLLATKGRPRRICKGVHQLIVAPVQAHSRKPYETRDCIVRLMGDIPRIELFARDKCEGWASWGNEIECDISLE